MNQKVFICHSSTQKNLVADIARELGVLNIHYDDWTFDDGYKTWDEILKALDDTGLFVFLASKAAFESSWVKNEIDKARELIDSNKLRGFFAINIDENLEITGKTKEKYKEFPQWVFDEYNMRQITSPKVIATKIKNKLNSILYELDTDYRKYRDIYFGRDEEKATFKKRISDRITNPLVCVAVSGLEGIGRKKILKKTLEEAAILRGHQEPPGIIMGEHESIENFILKLYATTFSGLEEKDILDLSSQSLDFKYKLAVNGLLNIGEFTRVFLIEDSNAIVDFEGIIAGWFDVVISKLIKEPNNKLLLALITKTRINTKYLLKKEILYHMAIKPLSKSDCKALFNTLCEFESIHIDNQEHAEMITDLFDGSPDQIFYAIKYIKSDSLVGLLQNLDSLRNFNLKRTTNVLTSFKGEKEKQSKALLKTLSKINIFNLDLLDNVVAPIYGKQNTYEIIANFTNNHVLELLKMDSFLYQVNRAIRIYVASNRNWKEDNKLVESLEKYLSSIATELTSLIENDFSLYELLVKEALSNRWQLDKRFVLPSYQLNLMIQKYREQRYEEVTQVAEELISNSRNLDKAFMDRHIWYCKSLIREKRENEFKMKVNLISDKPMRYVLYGFFHRLNQRYPLAIENLKKAEGLKIKGTMVLRELALCYSDIEDYSNAYKYAKRVVQLSTPATHIININFKALVRHTDYFGHSYPPFRSIVTHPMRFLFRSIGYHSFRSIVTHPLGFGFDAANVLVF